MSSSMIKLSIVVFVIQIVLGYENAYDLLERRNSRFYHPRGFYDGRYMTRNRFGNGYDNIGNGIPSFRRFNWRPIRDRFFDYPEYSGMIIQGRRQSYYRAPIDTHPYELRGDLGFGKVDRFYGDSEDRNERKSDGLYQRNQERLRTDFLRDEKAGEQLHSDQIGENKSSSRSNKVVKKSRTTKGFAVHHHKDETGNSTTFVDEVSDFGGHSDIRDISDEFGLRKTLEQTTYTGDEKLHTKTDDQSNQYDSGFLLGNQKYKKDYSTGGHHNGEYNTDNDDPHLTKTYQYLNGDKFDYTQPQPHDFY